MNRVDRYQSVRIVVTLALLTVAMPLLAQSYPIAPSVPRDQPAAEILGEFVVAKQDKRYMGWPDLVRAANGDLIAVFSGDRDWHVDPWGKVFTVRSTDGGKTWQEPVLVIDTPLDDRGTSLVCLSDGTLLLTFGAALDWATRDGPRYDPYDDHAKTIGPEVRSRWKGEWLLRSTDHGHTWSEPIKQPTRVPHGPIELRDGRLLLVKATVYESTDIGTTWAGIAHMEKPEDWKSGNAFLSEPHAIETEDGRIIQLSRYNHRAINDIDLRQIESSDGGRTWTAPTATGMRGYPPHLLQLDNGWLLASYSRRIAPMGQRATVSKDHGRTWEVAGEVVLSIAAPQGAGDLGYPSSVQLDDGSIYTVYYQVEKESDGEYPCLMGTHWKLKP